MLKRFLATLGILAGLLSPVYASGTIPFSLSQQFDQYGKPLAGCLFYTIQAGTTSTPQNAYQDSALTIPLPNPMQCDAAGRLPQFYLADGLIKVRITDKNGVSQNYPNGSGAIDNIQVIGASSGSGGGGTVDATTILATGDLKVKYGTGSLSGFVRANGRTIGSATSGATERANADTQALFEYLWGADSTLTVSGGRGASANADWTANKTITLPDLRGRVIAGLDDMGNSAAGNLTSTTISSGATTLGAVGGAETRAITTTYLPASGLGAGTLSVSGKVVGATTGDSPLAVYSASSNQFGLGSTPAVVGLSTQTLGWSFVSMSGSTANMGTGTSMPMTPPMMLMTMYIKL